MSDITLRRVALIDSMTWILVVEDDEDIADLVSHHLQNAGYVTDTLYSGEQVLASLREKLPDLLLLDLMLPGLNGLEICRAVRSDHGMAGLPIIILTAKGEETDRVVGLEVGADDYVTKPFSPKELVARVGAVLRRTKRTQVKTKDGLLRYRNIVIDEHAHKVTVDDQVINLAAKEFLLLIYLIKHSGRVLSRDLLLTDVWGYQYTGGTRTVDVHVRRLREKIPSLQQAITTVKQFGYKLVASE